ncbi:unnamed protein product [Sphacelaria rigidula]
MWLFRPVTLFQRISHAGVSFLRFLVSRDVCYTSRAGGTQNAERTDAIFRKYQIFEMTNNNLTHERVSETVNSGRIQFNSIFFPRFDLDRTNALCAQLILYGVLHTLDYRREWKKTRVESVVQLQQVISIYPIILDTAHVFTGICYRRCEQLCSMCWN